MKISDEVASHLCRAEIQGNLLKLQGDLERREYLSVDQVLQELGGKWNKRLKAHEFKSDPTDLIETAVLTQRCQSAKDIGFFPTPRELGSDIVEVANISDGDMVLEPSAGNGELVQAIVDARKNVSVVCYEIRPSLVEALRNRFSSDARVQVIEGDFLEVPPDPRFDRVVMNPPFSKRQDLKHIEHAYQFLKRSRQSKLVSVLSQSVNFRSDNMTLSFRKGVQICSGTLVNLPDNSFVQSGTKVKTSLVVIPGRDVGNDAVALQRIADAGR